MTYSQTDSNLPMDRASIPDDDPEYQLTGMDLAMAARIDTARETVIRHMPICSECGMPTDHPTYYRDYEEERVCCPFCVVA